MIENKELLNWLPNLKQDLMKMIDLNLIMVPKMLKYSDVIEKLVI